MHASKNALKDSTALSTRAAARAVKGKLGSDFDTRTVSQNMEILAAHTRHAADNAARSIQRSWKAHNAQLLKRVERDLSSIEGQLLVSAERAWRSNPRRGGFRTHVGAAARRRADRAGARRAQVEA